MSFRSTNCANVSRNWTTESESSRQNGRKSAERNHSGPTMKTRRALPRYQRIPVFALAGVTAAAVASLCSCNSTRGVRAEADVEPVMSVGVTRVTRKSLKRQITLSSELVPFQKIDIY